MTYIELDDVHLTFEVRHGQGVTLKEFLLSKVARRPVTTKICVDAIKQFNLSIREGERVGVIGHNGAGKSTLLKLLAGIYPPTRGDRRVEGKISSLFDIEIGFEPDATGWENIRYRGYLQGETPRTIRRKMEPIAEFAELGKFLEMPVRYYSAGMKLRLAFAIATAIDPEVLLVDEVLSVGDLAFQEKARRRMYEMMAKAKIIVMVSHDMDAIAKVCQRVLWLDHGTIRLDGQPTAVIGEYLRSVHSAKKAA